MADPPVIGSPTAIVTHPDGRFTVEFSWSKAPDRVWLQSMSDLMKRSGRESVEVSVESISLSFHPLGAEDALDDFAVLLEDAAREYQADLDQRAAAILHVQEALHERYGVGAEVPVRQP